MELKQAQSASIDLLAFEEESGDEAEYKADGLGYEQDGFVVEVNIFFRLYFFLNLLFILLCCAQGDEDDEVNLLPFFF